MHLHAPLVAILLLFSSPPSLLALQDGDAAQDAGAAKDAGTTQDDGAAQDEGPPPTNPEAEQEPTPEFTVPATLEEAIEVDLSALAGDLEALEAAKVAELLDGWMMLLRNQQALLQQAKVATEGSEEHAQIESLSTDRNTLMAAAEVLIGILVKKGGEVSSPRSEIESIRAGELQESEGTSTLPKGESEARELDLEVLKAQLRPMPQERVQTELEAWLGALQQKGLAIANVEVAALSSSDIGEVDRFTAQAVGLRAERDALIHRVEVVIEALAEKGGDVTTAEAYLHSLVGTPPVTGFRAALVTLRAWALSSDGGLRIAINTLKFLGILLVFRLLARLTGYLVNKALKALKRTSALLQDFLVGTLKKLVFVIGFVIALSQLGVDIGPLLAAIGAAGFVIGFALQGTISNFASGVMLMMYRPFEIGDLVDIGGVNGKVGGMNLVSTTIKTLDNQLIIVPNNMIWGGVITNTTASKTRRVDMVFGIGYEDDADKVRQILHEICKDHELVLQTPETSVELHEFGDSSVNFICRPWTRTEDYWTVYWDLQRIVKQRFDAEGISIPFPQRDVHVYRHGLEAE